VRVLTFEEHSSVLAAWWDLPRRPRTLVYLDAHLDLQPIPPARLRRVADCTTARQVAALNKPHHLDPDEGSAYGIEDFLYPAHRLGLIGRVVWVAPPHVLTADPTAAFERLQQMDGVEFEELLSFRRRPDGSVTGRLLGVEVAICDYRQLARMELPADSLIDIDIDYFVALPDETPWVRPRAVFDALSTHIPTPELVTITRSVSSGFTPLRYRFLADDLAALFDGRTAACRHYERLFDIDATLRAGAPEAAAVACRSALDETPDCPATWYLLSLACADPREALAARRRADLEPAYRADVLREACEFPGRGRPLDLATVRSLERRLAADRPGAAEEALTWAAIGILHCHLGRVEAACDCYRRTTRHFPRHPELAGALAGALVRASRPRDAIPYLDVAATGDKTAAGAHMLLATLYAHDRDLTRALAYLKVASDRAPAWSQLLELRSAVHAAAGEFQEADELRRRHGALRQGAMEFAQRIRPD
jgi:tetratricopeptide (TPR) repeat protein